MIAKSVGESAVECFYDFRRVLEVLCRFPRVMLWSVAFPSNQVLAPALVHDMGNLVFVGRAVNGRRAFERQLSRRCLQPVIRNFGRHMFVPGYELPSAYECAFAFDIWKLAAGVLFTLTERVFNVDHGQPCRTRWVQSGYLVGRDSCVYEP